MRSMGYSQSVPRVRPEDQEELVGTRGEGGAPWCGGRRAGAAPPGCPRQDSLSTELPQRSQAAFSHTGTSVPMGTVAGRRGVGRQAALPLAEGSEDRP